MATEVTSTPAERLARVTGIFGPEGLLEKHNVERKEAIDLLKLSTLSGVDLLFLGAPGVGKTWVIELLCKHGFADDIALFTHLLAKDQSADEVLGPRSVQALKQDEIRRIIEGYLPTAHYAYLDEVFKASPPMLNPLLDLLANRVLKMGGKVEDCGQLISVLMSSNELPEREDLQAFRDRIGVTYVVEPVKSPAGRRAVTDIQLDFQSGGIDTTGVEPLWLADIVAIRAEVAMVTVPDTIREMMGDAQQKWLEHNHPPSQRRIGQMWKVIKASAWAAGRSEVSADDLLPCQHMAFNNLDDRETARAVILEFASAFTRKADRLRHEWEPMLKQAEDLRIKLGAGETATDTYEAGMKFLGDSRKVKKHAKELIADGERQGQDVSAAEAIVADIDKAIEWAKKALIGDEE